MPARLEELKTVKMSPYLSCDIDLKCPVLESIIRKPRVSPSSLHVLLFLPALSRQLLISDFRLERFLQLPKVLVSISHEIVQALTSPSGAFGVFTFFSTPLHTHMHIHIYSGLEVSLRGLTH